MANFAAAADAAFRAFGKAATWKQGGAGAGVTVTVILKRPDEVVDLGDTRVGVPTVAIDVRASEVAVPVATDTFTIGADVFVVTGKPVRDAEQLVWACPARKQ